MFPYSFCLSFCRVPALPVKNLTGSGPVHPALAGQAASIKNHMLRKYVVFLFIDNASSTLLHVCVCCLHASGMTGILMCAAGLPVCLTRAPKPILHPPPINKSDMKPVQGINGTRRKTKKKHLRRGKKEKEMQPVV